MRLTISFASLVLFSATLAFAGQGPINIAGALANIQSPDRTVAQRSIDELRGAGSAGLDALLAVYDKNPDPKLIPAIDAVAGQRGAVVSRLYWYTDLSQAEAAAKEQAKPILYLRLMGKLTEEYSCANSRFFRTVLYSNRAVSAMLRERFILVWVSERPVPVVTIDYGDGRILKRTITGNSIHYVLDSNGQVYDALPGLFGPVAFEQIVNEAGAVARNGGDMGRTMHLQRADYAILRQWKQDVLKINPALLPVEKKNDADVLSVTNTSAPAAMMLTASKSFVETPLLRAISPQFAAEMDQSIDRLDAATWGQVAALHAADAALDEQSIAVIRDQNPTVYADPKALEKTVQQFQQTIAEDSVRDNFQMRRKVLAWLEQSKTPVALDDLNTRVYSELFLTPRTDPWLGLLPDGMYTALTNDGCCATPP